MRRRADTAASRATPRTRTKTRAEPAAADRLLHELQTHQIELEMQNEELKTARTDTEAATQRATELFDFAPIGYVVLSRQRGLVVQLNFAAARLLGIDRGPARQRVFGSFVAPEDRGRFARFLVSVQSSERQSEDLRLRVPGGERHVHLTAVLHPGSSDDILLSIEDVTARREAERLLQEASQRKDEFLAALSHELRNPLAPLQMCLAALTLGSETMSEENRSTLAIMGRQLAHLTRLVDDLLDVNRIAHGKIELKRQIVDLVLVTRRAVEDHRPSFEAQGVELTASLADRPAWVDGDPTRLTQVLGNLLGNALKFTPRGGRVEVAVQAVPEGVAVSLADSGAGMTADVLARAFEPFAQARQTPDRPRGGLGLGLALVKGLVERHGGTVGIASAGPGLGTAVRLRLPAAPAPPPVMPAPAPRHGGVHRVLIIDDNVDFADAVGDILGRNGQQTLVAYDGDDGLAKARTFAPDVVLCDLGLPGLDGFHVARMLREMLPAVRLFAVSGYAQSSDLERAKVAGFERHLAKPVDFDALMEILASLPPVDAGPPDGPDAPRRS